MINQYIGARYVPTFYNNPDGSWDWLPGISYEALTMVKYNGSTYTSKIPVPATIGAPNLNSTYWAETGSQNGEINQLQNTVGNHSLKLNGFYTLSELQVPETGDATIELQNAINKASQDNKALVFDHDVSCTHLAIQQPIYLNMNGYKINAIASNVNYDYFLVINIQTLNLHKTIISQLYIDAGNIENCNYIFAITAGRHIFMDSVILANVKTNGYIFQKTSQYSMDGCYIGRLRVIGQADNQEANIGVSIITGDSYIDYMEVNGFNTNLYINSVTSAPEYNRDIMFGCIHLWGIKTGMEINAGAVGINTLILDSLSIGIKLDSPVYLSINEIIDTLAQNYFTASFQNTINVFVGKISNFVQTKLLDNPTNFIGCLASNPITQTVTIQSGDTLYATLGCKRVGKNISVIVNGNATPISQIFPNTIPQSFKMDRCPAMLVPINDNYPLTSVGVAYINNTSFYLRQGGEYVFGVLSGIGE